jgi:hypothetical protein
MGIRTAKPIFFSALMLMVALPLFGAPVTVQGQQEVSGAMEERLLAFAKVHIEIANIRDDLHQDLARYHEVDGRTRVRQEADGRIEDALKAHGLDAREYEEFISAVSFDPELASAFEEALARARDGSGEEY